MRTTLVIMAAGLGSRFGGGIKQLAPVGLNGEIIMDYSIHDAIEAGLPDYAEVQPIFAFPVCKNIAFFSGRTKNPIERFYGPIDKIYTST